jgi:hypothetical protein
VIGESLGPAAFVPLVGTLACSELALDLVLVVVVVGERRIDLGVRQVRVVSPDLIDRLPLLVEEDDGVDAPTPLRGP